LSIAIQFFLIAIGFFLLIKGADFLIDGASSAAKKFNISEIAIGLTIVAFGTSAPEMVVNSFSAMNHHDEVVFGNIIGSNIFNLFLILGISGLIYPMSVRRNTVWKEIPFSLVITLILFLLINDEMLYQTEKSQAALVDGIILLGLFLFFMYYIFKNLRHEDPDLFPDEIPEHKIHNNWKTTLLILGGVAGLGLGGHLVVNNAIDVAQHYQVSEKLIGLTIISAGTSLPELVTSAMAAIKRKSDIAVGNVLGSNIFNVTLILGLSALITPLQYNTAFNIDFIVLFSGIFLLFFFMFTLGIKKLDRWEAMLFIIIFVGYMVFLFIRK